MEFLFQKQEQVLETWFQLLPMWSIPLPILLPYKISQVVIKILYFTLSLCFYDKINQEEFNLGSEKGLL